MCWFDIPCPGCLVPITGHPCHSLFRSPVHVDVEYNKDRPAGDLYPNLQVIKFLEADHDPQVLNPF